MKRYAVLRDINNVLEEYKEVLTEDCIGMDMSVPHEAVLFKKDGVGHISILMTNCGCYELVSFNERTGKHQAMFGHCEEFIDEIMGDYDVL